MRADQSAVFTKTNHTNYSDALIVEAKGLDWLRRLLPADKVAVPRVYRVDERCLQMERIQASGRCSESLARALGEGLAAMHAVRQPYFGFAEDNYIGLAPQRNRRHEDWGGFFYQQRLLAQIDRMNDAPLQADYRRRLQAKRQHLVEYLNASCSLPSLVHGDLWAGNWLCDGERGWLIDPAVHFADREVDLAMTELFGGFPTAFYAAYNRCLPVSEDYPRKREIYNLYHALNHLTLFGGSYRGLCEQGLAVIETL